MEELINKRVVEWSKKYKLNPLFLKEILILRSFGFNNTEIAKKTGISRATVSKYVSEIKKLHTIKEFRMLVFGCLWLKLLNQLNTT